MKPEELRLRHDELLKAAMQNAGVMTAMQVYQAAQAAVDTHAYAVNASVIYGQSTTTNGLNSPATR
ncbi:hypothetical protein [Paralcaligenes ginsengisoli]